MHLLMCSQKQYLYETCSSLSMLKQNLQHTKTFRLGQKNNNNKQRLTMTRNFELFFFFCQYFDLEQILGYDCFHDISVFDRKWSSCIISKACYKPHTIFYSLPVKDSLVYTSWKLLVAVHCRSGKNNLCEQFIRLMEIPLYVTYFLERVSFILSWQKNTLKQL